MKKLTGNCTRYKVGYSQFTEEDVENRLNKGSILPLCEGEAVTSGFMSFNENDPFQGVRNIFDTGWAMFRFCEREVKVDKKACMRHVKRAMFGVEFSTTKDARKEEKALQSQYEALALKNTAPTERSVQVLWNVSSGDMYFMSTSSKMKEAFECEFKIAMDILPVAVAFSGEAIDEQEEDNDFLTWLWYMCESYPFNDDKGYTLQVGGGVSVSGEYGKVKASDSIEEARYALLHGMDVSSIAFDLIYSDTVCSFTADLKSTLSSINTTVKGDVFDDLEWIVAAFSKMDDMYKEYLAAKAAQTWESDKKAIKSWAKGDFCIRNQEDC